jgi:LysM repeat protein
MPRMLLALVLLVAMLMTLLQGPAALALQPANLLKNPGFEGEFHAWSGLQAVNVAHNWTPWWRTHKESDPPAYYFKPEYKQANGYIYPNRVHGGASAQQWFSFHRTHQAGMYQQVFNVTPGQRYRFSIWAQVWSSSADDSAKSEKPAYPNLQVGIDPTGNWNAWAATVIWSGTYAFYDSWGQLSVEAVAQNNVITVFMRSEPNFPVKHNDMYWDDAALVAVSAGGAPAPQPATATTSSPPGATATAVPPPASTATCAPKPPDWVTYSVQRGDTLYSLARRSGTTLGTVMSVNCLVSSDIYTGQKLLLPRQPNTPTPARATSTPGAKTATPAGEMATPTSAEPTATATRTPTKLPTASATLAAAAPATPTRTPTRPPAATATPTATASPTPTVMPSRTPTKTRTATATPTKPTAAATPTGTKAPTPTEAPPTLPPPATATPGSPAPPATSTPAERSVRPCGTIYVGAGIVVLAGVLRIRRRGRAT